VDDDGIWTTSKAVNVTNVSPQLLNLAATPIVENGITHFTGTVSDPGLADSFSLTIYWGDDPSAPQVFSLAAGTTDFQFEHRYLDDEPGPVSLPDDYTITATIVDDDFGSGAGTAQVTVDNAPPTILEIGVSPDPVGEERTLSVSGSIDDLGTLDHHTVEILWGDGEFESAAVDLTSRTFSATHAYADDGDYTITATASDDDGDSAFATTVAHVENLSPQVSSAIITPEVIHEGSFTSISGTYSDASLVDTHTLVVDWGDGSSSAASVDAGDRTFTASHLYLDDDPTATPADDYVIRLTLTDDDGGLTVAQVIRKIPGTPPRWSKAPSTTRCSTPRPVRPRSPPRATRTTSS
jgi:hypothetical protein